MNDKEFLQWIYERMVYQHNENPLYDYMHKLKAIVDNMGVVKENCNLACVSVSVNCELCGKELTEQEKEGGNCCDECWLRN